MTARQEKLNRALRAAGVEFLTGPGGYHIRGEGFVSLAGLYRRYNIPADPPKAKRLRQPNELEQAFALGRIA